MLFPGALSTFFVACEQVLKGRLHVKPKAVLAYCREKGVKAVDIRFPDGLGRWRHFSIPASGLNESMFEAGLGIESCLPYQNSDEQTPWILVPVADSKYLDPIQSDPTLVLMASIQDAWTGEEAWFDPRGIAVRTAEAFRGAGLADEIMVATTLPFHLHSESNHSASELNTNTETTFGGGSHDPNSLFRSELMNLAIEAGLGIERHYRGALSSSEFLLNTKPLVQACDEQIVLRALTESTAMLRNCSVEQTGLFTKCSLDFVKGNEPSLGGARGFGLSDLGWYAAGGLLKHSKAIAAIASASAAAMNVSHKRASKPIISDRVLDSLVAIEPVSNDPRYRSLIYRDMPANCCPYLTLSAIAMAMLDGILHKTAPVTELAGSHGEFEKIEQSRKDHAQNLADDTNFLLHAEVFPEQMIESIYHRLANAEE